MQSQSDTNVEVPYLDGRPLPVLKGPFQPGISDPQWPIGPPAHRVKTEGDRENYLLQRAGRVDPQRHVTIVTADVNVSTRDALRDLLQTLSTFVRVQMERKPDGDQIPILQSMPKTWRVTVTIGLGSSLFLSAAGDDRFGLRHLKPRWLRTMPPVIGDRFRSGDAAADLIFVIASDHPYVNVSIGRALCQGNWGEAGVKEKRLAVRTLDQGFSRPDSREFLRFNDGIDNLSNVRDHELDRIVYVGQHDGEPDWAVNGSYLVWRKIREDLITWEAFSDRQQEQMIGRQKASGCPLSRQTTGPSGMTPVYPNATDPADGPIAAHIRKVQPRRPGLDFTGTSDLDRRFLRRGYPYFDGIAPDGTVSCGLLFLAFMHDLRNQFEWVVQNWQLNPDFPQRGTGIDRLYGNNVLVNLTGGYYFCPPAPSGVNGFLGSALFA